MENMEIMPNFLQWCEEKGYDKELGQQYHLGGGNNRYEMFKRGDEAEIEVKFKRWIGIQLSSKERKPRTSKKNTDDKFVDNAFKFLEELNEFTNNSNNQESLIAIWKELTATAELISKKIKQIDNAQKEKYNQALALLNEFNKATGQNYKIVEE